MNLKLWGFNDEHRILRIARAVCEDFDKTSGSTLIRGSAFRSGNGSSRKFYVEIVHERHERKHAIAIGDALQEAGFDVELPPPIKFYEGKKKE